MDAGNHQSPIPTSSPVRRKRQFGTIRPNFPAFPYPLELQTPHPRFLSITPRSPAPGYPDASNPPSHRCLPVAYPPHFATAQSPTERVNALNQGILALMKSAEQKVPARTRLQQFEPVVRENYDLETSLRVAASPDYDRAPPDQQKASWKPSPVEVPPNTFSASPATAARNSRPSTTAPAPEAPPWSKPA